MKLIGLVIMLFGLATAIYGAAVVVPRYVAVNTEWASTSPSYGGSSYDASERTERHERLSDKRDVLRSRAQSYALAANGCAAVAFLLALITRKRPGIEAKWVVMGSVVTGMIFGFMQVYGNIF